MSHEFTVEVLYHFNCHECKNWWGHTMTPVFQHQHLTYGMVGKDIHCPHCGLKSDVKVKENFFEQ